MEISNTSGSYAFFISNLGNGGAEMHLLRLSNELVKRGCNVTLIIARRGGNYEKFLHPDLNVIHLTRRIGSSMVALVISLFLLPSVLRRQTIDLVMSVLPWPNIVILLLKKCGVVRSPVIINIQNTPLHADNVKCSLPKRLINAISKWLYPTADGIVAISRGIKEDLRMLLPASDSNVEVIHNIALDDLCQDQIKSRTVTFKSDVFNIVSCGRLTEQKGYTYLLDAFNLLKERVKVHLHILGKGPLEKELKEKASKLGITEQVTFWGFQENPMAFINAGDLFVLSSIWEGFGNVIAEAMACGKAVVATDCKHGPSEIINDKDVGLLVPVKDPYAMSEVIYSLLSQRATILPLMEKKALARSKDFSAAIIGTQYVRFFTHVKNNAQKQSFGT